MNEFIDAHRFTSNVAYFADGARAGFVGHYFAYRSTRLDDPFIQNDIEQNIDDGHRFLNAFWTNIDCHLRSIRTRTKAAQRFRWCMVVGQCTRGSDENQNDEGKSGVHADPFAVFSMNCTWKRRTTNRLNRTLVRKQQAAGDDQEHLLLDCRRSLSLTFTDWWRPWASGDRHVPSLTYPLAFLSALSTSALLKES